MVIVGQINDFGVDYLIVKNNMGTSWGYNGYMKIEKGRACGLTNVAFKPKLYPAYVPPADHPQQDFIQLYSYVRYSLWHSRGKKWFSNEFLQRTPYGISKFYNGTFSGISFPETDLNGKKTMGVSAFTYENCRTDKYNKEEIFYQVYEKDYPREKKFKSLGVHKKKQGCVSFYKTYCATGEPAFTVCGEGEPDVTTQPWYKDIPLIKSVIPDGNAYKGVMMYTEPNYKGSNTDLFTLTWYYTDDRGRTLPPIFNMDYHRCKWDFRDNKIKSIKLYN